MHNRLGETSCIVEKAFPTSLWTSSGGSGTIGEAGEPIPSELREGESRAPRPAQNRFAGRSPPQRLGRRLGELRTGCQFGPGKAAQNGYVESFNGRMRDELQNESLFFAGHTRGRAGFA